ncbi:MAG: Crp/Fnr family transcriptional regulator [Balneolaceae bacterium]
MSDKRKTPLSTHPMEGHHCTVDLRLEKLGMVSFFQDLTKEQLLEVNGKCTAIHYSKSEIIYRQGDISTMLRVVVAGNVKLAVHTPEGDIVLMDMLQPGDFFGNLSASGKDVYNETAETQTAACILSIRLNDFRNLMNRYPSVAMSVLDITTNRLSESRQRIRHLSTLPVTKRIAHILITLGNKFGEGNRHGLLIQLPLSRKDLADMAGTSTTTASRIMSRFQQDGLITSGRQWVAVKNMNALSEIVSAQ